MDDELTLDNFMRRPSLEHLIRAITDGTASEPLAVYMWGGEGTGKSHLLQALCHQMGNNALYLPMGELTDIPPAALLENHEAMALLAVDDVESVVGGPWEEALFHCFNQVFAGPGAPASLTSMLPDLRSRLGSLTVYQLAKFSEQELESLLAFRAARRGIKLSSEVLGYLLARMPRSVPAVMALLEELDREGLARGRAITIPLIASLKLVSSDPSV
jgi:DnaA family protein